MKKQSNHINIAYAEDHTIIRKGVLGILSSFEHFHTEFEAENGLELIDKLEKSDHLPDICILDLNMPILNGYDTMLQIKSKWPMIKVLILTMFNNEFSIIRMLKNGASGYLLKSVPPEILCQALNDINNNGFFHSEFISKHIFHVFHNSNESLVPDINNMEMKFLSYCGTDLNYKEIAAKMNMSVRTIEGYRDSLFDKIQVHTRIGLVMYGLNIGVIPFNQKAIAM